MQHSDSERALLEAEARLRARDASGALALIDAALSKAPRDSELHRARGAALRMGGNLDAALGAFHAAVASDGGNASAHGALADALRASGDNTSALTHAERACALAPTRADLLRTLALCRHAVGDFAAAANAARAAVDAAPEDARLQRMLGQIAHDSGALEDAIAANLAWLQSQRDDVDAMTDVGMALAGLRRPREAGVWFKKALALAPDHLPAEFGLRESMAQIVPPWHVPMMNEPQRNLAYRDAIRALVRPNDLVLEIGSGAGLLAMMAAEAGAGHVITCEMVEEVAEEARAIIARNGLADRVTVVSKHSQQLRIGEDLPERADVLISEILADDFVGEDVLPSLADASTRLLKPGARVIPSSGEARGVLVGGAEVEYLLGLGEVCGFDVRSFAKFRPWRQAIQKKIEYDALSDDVTLLRYDFREPHNAPAADAITITATAPGLCYGLLQWIRVDLAPGVRYENHPRTTESVWNKTLYAFPSPVVLQPGDALKVRIWQQGGYFYVTSA